ncbi:amino acid/amide ABC transporter substrate-binding protein, HAAT family [Raineyella antarctica]|uniref:Amino acid/amide ABC transporter substrate-binding protein, HAAT family n=1 Tax=Raineyella antarctica TaxID=1577474 RepID=A0A1G6IB69_9ACTN|nr:ABC transporter substrate-binding protein [Raineyella antarctica]SDC03643.1 amino acid/amide ABC transporter substrate-binding protein, HAAT family [Raineyella antarctica]
MSFLSASFLRKAAVVPALVGAMMLTACGGGSLGGGSGGSGGTSGSVKIGLSVPKSGTYAALGKDMEQGFKLYLTQNDNKLGGKTVQLVETDEGNGPQTGIPATERLVTQDQVSAVVGLVNSATASGLANTFNQNKVPLIVANAGSDKLVDTPSDYIWRTSFTNGGVNAPMGAKVKEEIGSGSVYLLGSDYAAGKEQVGGFKKAFTAAGGKVAGEEYTPPFGATTDWQPYLNNVRNSGAKAVYVFYAGSEAVGFVKQFKQFLGGTGIKLYGSGFLTEGSVLDAQGDAANGVQTSLHYSDQLDNPKNKEFVKAYSDAYKTSPTVYSVQAYDAANVLAEALKKADGTTGEAIGAAIGKVGQIDSPRGTWSFNAQHDPDQKYYLREVRVVDGKRVNAVVEELKAG